MKFKMLAVLFVCGNFLLAGQRGVVGAAPYKVARSFRKNFLKAFRLHAKPQKYFFIKVFAPLFSKSGKVFELTADAGVAARDT